MYHQDQSVSLNTVSSVSMPTGLFSQCHEFSFCTNKDYKSRAGAPELHVKKGRWPNMNSFCRLTHLLSFLSLDSESLMKDKK